ncbi:MAG: NADH:ubiquinone reductase (Na(+)-transporting) subunit C [Flavobacteriales bacterium]|jgi:Na+-transporting NADH:ubiquinone oxidoreductase subunit C|nr:NADH:ubiquinone reductase (Na(+)-transporting) subunit C [Flavobacteriales bacterium]
MAINRESNGYTILFAVIMVTVVGGILAFLATALKPAQEANVRNEKMQNILQAIGIEATDGISRKDAGTKFNDYVVERVTLDFEGNEISRKTNKETIEGEDDAFNIDLLKEYKTIKAKEERNYPLFICEADGERFYVVPVLGKGLWAAVWGYVGLKEDGTTINGAVFDHKSETPGLGAEISKDFFEKQFIGKTIDEAGKYAPIKVLKPGLELGIHEVDGISGGTFTSVGVKEMLERTLVVYYDYFKNKK